MTYRFSGLPEDVVLGPVSAKVFSILEQHTSFPWPVLFAQARRTGADPSDLSIGELVELTPLLATAVGRFTSASSEQAVHEALEALCANSR